MARLAVDAPGAGQDGRDLALRSKQRLWLARPAQLRVEVLGFLDTTLAVLVTDGERYSLFESQEQRFEEGPVYPELLWDAAHLALTPAEAVEVILGAPEPDAGLTRGAAYLVGERVRIDLTDPGGRVRRVVEFGAGGELRRLAQSDESGEVAWEALFDDYAEIDGAPFARDVALRSASGRTHAALVLRAVELNPDVPADIFRLRPPARDWIRRPDRRRRRAHALRRGDEARVRGWVARARGRSRSRPARTTPTRAPTTGSRCATSRCRRRRRRSTPASATARWTTRSSATSTTRCSSTTTSRARSS